MKKKYILLTIFCLITINSDFVFTQIRSDSPTEQKRIIERMMKESPTSLQSSQLQNTAPDMILRTVYLITSRKLMRSILYLIS